jgi:hypothetical protein
MQTKEGNLLVFKATSFMTSRSRRIGSNIVDGLQLCFIRYDILNFEIFLFSIYPFIQWVEEFNFHSRSYEAENLRL